MVKLDYQISPSWNEKAGAIDLSRADESTLLYNAFLGDVVFSVEGVDFSARWGWVPILDFARSFFLVFNELASEPQFTYEFTESDAAINLKKVDGEVIVSATYAAGMAKVSYEAFDGGRVGILPFQRPTRKLNPMDFRSGSAIFRWHLINGARRQAR
jgi:hypothetical protein